MAFMPLTFGALSESTQLSRARSPASSGSQLQSWMPPSRETASPPGFKIGQIPLRARHRPAQVSPGEVSIQSFHAADRFRSAWHAPEEQPFNVPPSPRVKPRYVPDHQAPKPGLRKCRRNPDHGSLFAIGSWSSPRVDHGDYYAPSGHMSRPGTFDDGSLVTNAAYDDFLLFPDENLDDFEDPSMPADYVSSTPMAPRITRLRTPDIAPLSTDVQFFPCLGDEAEEDRINEAWYLAGRERVDCQLEDALAYMTGVEGRRHVLRDSSGVP